MLTDSDMTDIMLLNNADRMRSKSSSRGGLPRSWILLDSQSTIDVFCNRKLLTGIHRVKTNLHIRCNAGVKTTNMRGYLSGYGDVWYFQDGIANILSLSQVKEKFRVTYDSAADNAFHVHKPDKILIFKEATRRLYYYDTADRNKESTVLIQTVDENKSKFTTYDYSRAKLARKIQRRNGRPGTAHYICIIQNKGIPNCPITVQDIKNAEIICGPDLGCLKGKTVCSQPMAVRVPQCHVPMQIMQHYRHVTISVDVMKVNNIPLFMTISKHIKCV